MSDRQAAQRERRRPVLSCWVWGLVGVTLAVVLLSVVYPMFARTSADNRPDAFCLSRLQGIARGSLMYATDYDGHFVQMPGWDDALRPYVMRREPFHCPRDERKDALSYAMNPSVAGLSVAMAEFEHKGSGGLILPDDAATVVAFYDGVGRVVIERHKDGANYTFLDSSVKWLADPPEGSGLFVGEEQRR